MKSSYHLERHRARGFTIVFSGARNKVFVLMRIEDGD